MAVAVPALPSTADAQHGAGQSAAECILQVGVMVRPADVKVADDRIWPLLRACRERQHARAADNANEFASPHVPPQASGV